MFSFIREKLSKIYESVTQKLATLFTQPTVDDAWLQELQKILLTADTGLSTTKKIIEELRVILQSRSLSGQEAHAELSRLLLSLLPAGSENAAPPVLLMVGVNGSGKTTFLGKLAYRLTSQGKKVLLIAADTFRAAAPEQLAIWAERTGAQVMIGKENQDPASVVFDGCVRYQREQFDHLLIDTAGRLHTKINLMNELEKIHRIIARHLPQTEVQTWLALDSMLGQNSITQATQFNEVTKLNGLVMTKCDGTGKGGALFAITNQLHLPIQYLTCGESLTALQQFNPQLYVDGLLNK